MFFLAVTMYKIITPFWNTESKSLSLGVSIGDHLSNEGTLGCTNPQCKQQKGMIPEGGQGSWEKCSQWKERVKMSLS